MNESISNTKKTRVFNDEKVTMTLRLDPLLRAEFELAAKSLDRSSAALVREMMREAIKKYKQNLGK